MNDYLDGGTPAGEPKLSVSEQVWGAAEKAGAERRAKFEKTMNRIFGLPEAAGKLIEIGSDRVKAKAEEIKGKAEDLKDRTETKIKETWKNTKDRCETAWDNFTDRVDREKTKVVNKAIEIKDKAVRLGVETGFNIEEKIAGIFVAPAVKLEQRAGEIDTEVGVLQEEKGATNEQYRFLLEKIPEEQRQKLENFERQQKMALEAFLAEQKRQNDKLKESFGIYRKDVESQREEVVGLISEQIKEAQNKSKDLKNEAEAKRASVEKRRVFKGLLAKIK